MTVSVPRFAIKLAGRECSRWNLLITQFKYTGILPNKSSSKSKKLETKLASSLFGVGSIGGEWMLTRHLPCAAGFRGCGKVGILVLDFHSSTALRRFVDHEAGAGPSWNLSSQPTPNSEEPERSHHHRARRLQAAGVSI